MAKCKCPVCKIGNVEQGKYDKEYFCDNEFCPSYDETDSSTYNILIRTTEELHKANAELDYIEEQIEKNGAFDNTRKALEIAKTHLGYIKNNYHSWTPYRDEQMIAQASNCLAKIQEIEDGNL